MTRVVGLLTTYLVLAGCGSPPGLVVDGQLVLECQDDCQSDVAYEGTMSVTLNDNAELGLEVTSTNVRISFGETAVLTVNPSLSTTRRFSKGGGEEKFFFKCDASDTILFDVTDSEQTLFFATSVPITCIEPPGDLEVRGPNGGVIPNLGEDAAGVKPHGVQFTREYTIKNIGQSNLTLMSTSFGAGTNCTGVVLVQANPTALAPGAMGSMTVGVTPTAAGAFECIWDLASSDPDENPYEVSVTGTAPSGDIAVSAPSTTGPITDGGTQAVGVKPAGVTFTEVYRIDNEGLSSLTLGQVTIGTLVNCTVTITTPPSTQPLPAQTTGATTMALSITPTGPGAFMCPVSIANNDPDENPFDWTITGNATAPEIEVANFPDASTDNVGSVRVGSPLTRAYLIQNTGTGPLAISAVTPGTMTNCTLTVTMAPAASVAPAGMTMLSVSLTPTAEGAFSCAFDITNNDADEAFYDLFITGTAIAPKIELEGPGGVITVQGTDSLGSHAAGVPFTRMYTIRNVGTGPLTLTSVTGVLTCTNCTDVITPPAMLTVPAGGSTTFSIQFTPTGGGTFDHTFRIASDATNVTPFFEFAASGFATEAQIFIATTFSGPFEMDGTEIIPGLSAGQTQELTWIVRNKTAATAPLTLTGLLDATSTMNVAVTITKTLAASLAPNTSDSLGFIVQPQAAGPFSFDLVFDSNDLNNPHIVIHVMGTATAPPDIEITNFPSGSTDDVGAVGVGSAITRMYTVRNNGVGALDIGNRAFTDQGNCTLSSWTGPTGPIAAGGSATMSITVGPTAAGNFTCGFSIASNDPDAGENPYLLTLSGTTPVNIGNFGSMIGTYAGDNGCGIGGWSLENVGGLRVDSFGSNPDDFPITVGADPNVATGTGFVIFGVPNHPCTFTKQGTFTIIIRCNSPSGGSCTENSSKL